MTENQRKGFYFPKWLRLAQRLDWVMESGRLVANLDAQWDVAAQFSTVARDLVRGIIRMARGLAGQEQRAVTADDLRHAMNLLATQGRSESATKMTNQELNEFDRMHQVLMDPWHDNLKVVIPYLNPADDDRRRMIGFLHHLGHDAQLVAISENAFGTRDWESLDRAKLDWLAQEVKRSGRIRAKAF